VADGLLHVEDDGVQLLPQGQLMVRSVAMAFDAYLGGQQKGQFSRTV
jgi:oxygen-independent coproporphyrinogen III oxidase